MQIDTVENLVEKGNGLLKLCTKRWIKHIHEGTAKNWELDYKGKQKRKLQFEMKKKKKKLILSNTLFSVYTWQMFYILTLILIFVFNIALIFYYAFFSFQALSKW